MSFYKGYSNSQFNPYDAESTGVSSVEKEILRASNPPPINESDTITVNGQTGIWANKAETINWRGPIAINEYRINDDPNPEIIRKSTDQRLTYDQEIAIRYLRPPTPPPPGEIIIKQEKNIPTPPAPPLVIRQQPPRPETPPPLVIREAPPRPPEAVGSKFITISGKRLPPPPRKVVVERLPPIPTKPQAIIIERWLPYTQHRRKVIYTKPNESDPIAVKPKNIIIQWEPPKVTVEKTFKDLGVVRANPIEYVERYGNALKSAEELPNFVKEIKPSGLVLAAEKKQKPAAYELVGDIHALQLIDLDIEGLGEYKHYLQYPDSSSSITSSSFTSSIDKEKTDLLARLFAQIDKNGQITIAEGEQILNRLNFLLGKKDNATAIRAFLHVLDHNHIGLINYQEFKEAIIRSL